MSCNFLNFKDCQVKGSTFSSVKFNFPGRDISGDTFFMLLKDRPQRRVNGIVVENEVLFPYGSFQDLMVGRYIVEFWADFADIGLKAIARQELEISEAGKASKCCEQTGAVFGLDTGDTVVDYSISLVVINLREGGEVQWDEIEGKPTVFYDDTEIKEEIAEKVDKVDGFGLSENNFSDADLEKLEGLENFDPTNINNALANKVDKIEGKGLSDNNYSLADKTKLDGINLSNYVLQTALNSQLTSYVLQSNLNTQLQSYATLNGVQTFNSTITFAQAPIVPTATLNGHAVNLGQLANVNVGSASKLQTARAINGTAFDGTGSVITATWGTQRNITIGNSNKPFNGGSNITWTLAEIGAVPVADTVLPNRTWNFTTNGSVGKYNSVPNEWVNLVLNGQDVNKTFLPIIEVSDDGISWTNLNLTDTLKYFNGGNASDLTIPNNYFRFTFRMNNNYNGYYYMGIRTTTLSPGSVISGKYEHSADGLSWIENTFGNNPEQVTNVYNATYFAVQNPSRQYHRLTVQRHSGQNIRLSQVMFLSNSPGAIDTFTVAKTDLETSQLKPTASLTLSSTNTRSVIISTANRTITVPSNLPDNFEATFIADGGTITFANSGTTFKFNNSKVLLASGGIATLRKENGTNNFYLKGDLS